MNLVNKNWTVQSCTSSSNLGFGPNSILNFQAGQNPATYDIHVLGGGKWAACSETAVANKLEGTYQGCLFDISYQTGSHSTVTCRIYPAAFLEPDCKAGIPDITWTAVDVGGGVTKGDPCRPPCWWPSW